MESIITPFTMEEFKSYDVGYGQALCISVWRHLITEPDAHWEWKVEDGKSQVSFTDWGLGRSGSEECHLNPLYRIFCLFGEVNNDTVLPSTLFPLAKFGVRLNDELSFAILQDGIALRWKKVSDGKYDQTMPMAFIEDISLSRFQDHLLEVQQDAIKALLRVGKCQRFLASESL